ncbi:MAG: hypothetical protein M0Z67_08355 [Nitrospiraceae bacterium]|nr:hypothetical protein [Nitrospiraceae bacterium]
MKKKGHNQRLRTVAGGGQLTFPERHSWFQPRLRESQSNPAAFMAFFSMSASVVFGIEVK